MYGKSSPRQATWRIAAGRRRVSLLSSAEPIPCGQRSLILHGSRILTLDGRRAISQHLTGAARPHLRSPSVASEPFLSISRGLRGHVVGRRASPALLGVDDGGLTLHLVLQPRSATRLTDDRSTPMTQRIDSSAHFTAIGTNAGECVFFSSLGRRHQGLAVGNDAQRHSRATRRPKNDVVQQRPTRTATVTTPF